MPLIQPSRAFHPTLPGIPEGDLTSRAWALLRRGIQRTGVRPADKATDQLLKKITSYTRPTARLEVIARLEKPVSTMRHFWKLLPSSSSPLAGALGQSSGRSKVS
jgi:hypothetical protein